MRHVYIPIKMANIKKLRIPRTDKQAEHKELSYTADENGKWDIQPLWKTAWQFLSKQNIHTLTT